MKTVERFDKNGQGNDFIVGDIHGAFEELEHCLEEIGFDTSVDRLFCVGDLVDRGDTSERCLEWLQYPWFHSVRGNHEQLLIGNYEGDYESYHIHMMNGGVWYEGCDEQTREAIYQYCNELPYIIEVETDSGFIGILHADTGNCYDWNEFKRRVVANERNARETCLWSRVRISSGDRKWVEGVKEIYVGHTPLHSEASYGNVNYIDTGACFTAGHFTIKHIS